MQRDENNFLLKGRTDKEANLTDEGAMELLQIVAADVKVLLNRTEQRLHAKHDHDRKYATRLLRTLEIRQCQLPTEVHQLGEVAWLVLVEFYLGAKYGTHVLLNDKSPLSDIPETILKRYLTILCRNGFLEKSDTSLFRSVDRWKISESGLNQVSEILFRIAEVMDD